MSVTSDWKFIVSSVNLSEVAARLSDRGVPGTEARALLSELRHDSTAARTVAIAPTGARLG